MSHPRYTLAEALTAADTRVAQLAQRLQRFEPLTLEITDDSAAHAHHASAQGGSHFHVLVVSKAFGGQSLIQRHRHVYEAVSDLIPHEIHALSLRTLTPDEYPPAV